MRHPGRVGAMWRRTLAVGITLATALAWAGAAPALANSYAGYSTSHYMETVSGSTLYSQGCSVGQAATNGSAPLDELVILDFGQPWYSGGYGTKYWYGTSGTFASTATIANAVEQFGAGFWHCSSSSPQLIVAAGENSDSSEVTSADAAAWDSMVVSINTWLFNNNYTSQVQAEGAIDAEKGFYANESMIVAWAKGYGSSTLYQDFGSANGCSWTSYGTSYPGLACPSGTKPLWTQDDYWEISWGAPPAEPFPEDYNTNTVNLPNGTVSDEQSQQWEMIRLYGNAVYGRPVAPYGVMTERGACGCGNTSSTAWTHLHASLGFYAPTDSTLNYASDIKWGF